MEQFGIVSDAQSSREKNVLTFPASTIEETACRLLINGWRLRPSENRLVRDHAEIKLEPKAMDLLLRLAAARGDALSRSELISALWPNVYASDDSLNRIVSRLRRALAKDEALSSAVITVPKRGYRLSRRVIKTAETSTPDAAQPSNAQPDPRHKFFGAPILLIGVASLIVIAGLITYTQSNRPQPVDYFNLQSRPLTKMVGHENGARFSPDGQRVAFSWDAESAQGSDIYVQAIGEFTPQKITHHANAEFNPAWSPDGRELAFIRANPSDACNIVTINLESAIEKVVHTCKAGQGVDLSWAANAQILYFTDRVGATGPFAVHQLDLTTNQADQITFPEATSLGDFVVRVSPSGEELAFVRRTTYIDTDVYVSAADGNSIRQVTQDQRNINGLSWDADNSHLFFTTSRASAFGLWRTDKNDRHVQPVPTVIGDAESVTVSPDGARIVYKQKRINSKVLKISLSGAAPGSLLRSGGVSSRDQFLDLSPNEKQLAYISDRSGETRLWIGGDEFDEEGPADIDMDLLMSADWSPDGKQLLVGGFAKGNFDLYLVAPDGRTVRRLTTHPSSDYNPTWSSDGKYAYFTSNRTGRFEIWCIEIATGGVEQITMQGGHRAIESSGERLYFAKKYADGLYQLDLTKAGAKEQRLTGRLSALDWRNWDLTGERLYYVERENQKSALLRRMDLATGADDIISDLDNLPLESGLTITPDEASAYVTTIVSAEADLMLLEGLDGRFNK